MAQDRWETIKAEKKQRENSRNFIEVKRTKDKETGNEFLTLAKGFIAQDGNPRYNKAISINFDEVDFVISKLQEFRE